MEFFTTRGAKEPYRTGKPATGQRSRYITQDFKGDNSVHISAEYGSLESLRILRDRGADVSEICEFDKKTPLHIAAEHGQVGVVQFLLDIGVDPTVEVDDTGLDALHLAAYWGQLEVAQLLLERGASTTTKDNYGRTAISLAASAGHKDVVLLIVDWSKEGTTIPSTELNNLNLSTDRMQDSIQTSSGNEFTTS